MNRRRRNRRKSNAATIRRNRYKRVMRKPTNIRYANIANLLPKRELYSRNKTLASQIIPAVPQSKLKSATIHVSDHQRKKTPCHIKLEKNDLSRRRAFFKSHSHGGSNRPEHKRTHRRC